MLLVHLYNAQRKCPTISFFFFVLVRLTLVSIGSDNIVITKLIADYLAEISERGHMKMSATTPHCTRKLYVCVCVASAMSQIEPRTTMCIFNVHNNTTLWVMNVLFVFLFLFRISLFNATLCDFSTIK